MCLLTMQYRYASISELSAALEARQVSALDLAKEAIAMVSRFGPHYNAVSAILRDRAQSEATAADRRRRAGEDSALLGIPYGAKDVFAARGAPTAWGSSSFSDQVFDVDATVISRLKRDGAILIAKLAMSELAGGGRAAAPGASLHGQGRNPWDVALFSGGSSSGSAIAVAMGLLPFALGTETGGSILGPAAYSGVTGLRPTFGAVPRRGAMTLSWSLDKIGPLARSADDCALVMRAISTSFRRYAKRQSQPNRRIRVGFSTREMEEASPSIRHALGQAIDELRQLYPSFIDLELHRDPHAPVALEDIIRIEGAFEFRKKLREPAFTMSDERQLATLRSGLAAPSVEYLEAMRVTTPRAVAAFRQVFSKCDVLVSASRVDTAPPLDEPRAPRDASKLSELIRAAGNLAGVPGVSIPCGMSDEGLPVAMQIVGPRNSEALLLRIASRYQRKTEHHLRRPPDPALFASSSNSQGETDDE